MYFLYLTSVPLHKLNHSTDIHLYYLFTCTSTRSLYISCRNVHTLLFIYARPLDMNLHPLLFYMYFTYFDSISLYKLNHSTSIHLSYSSTYMYTILGDLFQLNPFTQTLSLYTNSPPLFASTQTSATCLHKGRTNLIILHKFTSATHRLNELAF